MLRMRRDKILNSSLEQRQPKIDTTSEGETFFFNLPCKMIQLLKNAFINLFLQNFSRKMPDFKKREPPPL